jgi:hypothetical protein
MVGDAERERVGDVVAELESDDLWKEPDAVPVELGDPVCDCVTDPESDICAEDEEDKEPEVVAVLVSVADGEEENDDTIVPETEFVGERVKREVADIELVALIVRLRVAFELVDGVFVETADSLLRRGEGVDDVDGEAERVYKVVVVEFAVTDAEELLLPVADSLAISDVVLVSATETATASRRKHKGDSPKRKRVDTKLRGTGVRICTLCYVSVASNGKKDGRSVERVSSND